MEEKFSISHLQRKVFMWWDQLKQFKHIEDKRISWKNFKKCFRQKYFSKHYLDKKMQYFLELKLGSMTME
jgi:hypothetical protein